MRGDIFHERGKRHVTRVERDKLKEEIYVMKEERDTMRVERDKLKEEM